MDRRSFIHKSLGGLVVTGSSLSGTPGSEQENIALYSGSYSQIAIPAGIGICDWNLGDAADPSFIALASAVGLEAVQVSVGTTPSNIPLRNRSVRQNYIELGKRHKIVFCSVAAGGILNQYPLATEPQSAIFVLDALEAARALGSKNILTAFFGNGDLLERDTDGNYINTASGPFSEYRWKEKDVARTIALMKQIVPRAEDLGITIGLENTLSARQNLQIIEEIGSPVVQVYYDVGNSWGNGYDVPHEIDKLGNHRICEVHLKNMGSRLLDDEKGLVDMKECARALRNAGYNKWLVLETSGRPGHFEEDTRTNAGFARRLFIYP
jgi:L-ribulose-5-phosphate 3-epimerase